MLESATIGLGDWATTEFECELEALCCATVRQAVTVRQRPPVEHLASAGRKSSRH